MVSEALRASLTACEGVWGEVAGDAMLQLAEDRGLETDIHNVYDMVTHHACLADILVSAIRKPDDDPWLIPDPVQNWNPDCYLSPDGSHLRRIVLVSHWSDDRKVSECQNWYTQGEVAAYDLPMQLVVFIIGQQRNGKRLSPWCSGFLHPKNHQLRFRKKSRATTEVFNDKWDKIQREDHAEISRETWLEGMLQDDVLPEVCFRIDIPVLEKIHRQKVLDLARRQLDRMDSIRETPDLQLSGCRWPAPCQFLRCCHGTTEREPSEKSGYLIMPRRRASATA